jgi:hypothetical protein
MILREARYSAIPTESGIQKAFDQLKKMDSHFHGNDTYGRDHTSYGIIAFCILHFYFFIILRFRWL